MQLGANSPRVTMLAPSGIDRGLPHPGRARLCSSHVRLVVVGGLAHGMGDIVSTSRGKQPQSREPHHVVPRFLQELLATGLQGNI